MTTKKAPHEAHVLAQTAQDGSEPDALEAIKTMMADEDGILHPPSAEDQTPPAATPATKAQSLPPISDPVITDAEFVEVAPQSSGSALLARLKGLIAAQFKGFRPEKRHIVLGVVVVISVLRPWLVISAIVLTILAVVAAFLFMGYDGFWQKAMKCARWYAQRNPDRAAEMHAKLDMFALQWDAFLDRFPEGWVDSLYLPDFGEMAQADARHDAALDRRLSEMQNDAG